MRFLLLLPRTLPGLLSFTAPALKVLHALSPPDLSLGTSDGEQKGKGNYKRSVITRIPSRKDASLLCMSGASPMYFLLGIRTSPTAVSFYAVLPDCASAKCHLSSQPVEAPETLQQEPVPVGHTQASSCTPKCSLQSASTSRSSQDQPAEPVHHCTPVGALQLQAEGSCSCLEQYRFWRCLEHFGFCIWVILTL